MPRGAKRGVGQGGVAISFNRTYQRGPTPLGGSQVRELRSRYPPDLQRVTLVEGGVDVKQGVEGRQESVREGMCGLALHPYVPVDASAARWVRGSPRSGAAARYVARSFVGAESGRSVILGSRKHLSTDWSEPKAGNA